MHIAKLGVRLLALVAAIFAVTLAFSSLGQGTQHGAEATTFVNAVTCADSYFDVNLLADSNTDTLPDFGPGQPTFGNPPSATSSLWVATSLTRTETAAGVPVDSVQKLYLGDDVEGSEPPQTPFDGGPLTGNQEIIPDAGPLNKPCTALASPPPGTPAGSAIDDAKTGAQPTAALVIKASATSQFRPSGATDFTVSGSVLSSVSCVFTPPFGWIRQEVHINQLSKGSNAVNFGHAALFLGTASPASATDADGDTKPDYAANPSECTGGSMFPSYTVVRTLDARTDQPDNVISGAVQLDDDGPTATSGSAIPKPQDADGTSETTFVADDFDGDGCTDYDELSPALKSGLDPFNPEDCDNDIDGVYNLLTTVQAFDKTTGTPGTFFHCIADIDETAGSVDASVLCYQDSLGLSGNSAVPSHADGISGAPPPPPYTTAQPTNLTGSWDAGNKILSISGCFEELGPPLGPNVIVNATLGPVGDGGSLKGTVDIYGLANDNQCALGSGGVLLVPGARLVATEQVDGFDHDGDGCSDEDELRGTGTGSNTCGDDPYNPHDSNRTDLTGTYHSITTVVEAGQVHPTGPALPGTYFHCISTLNHDTGTNDIDSTIHCYTDSVQLTPGPDATLGTADDQLVGIAVNFQDSGSAACAPVAVGAPTNTNVCGDGQPGTAPPGPLGASARTWADVVNPHTTLTGTYNPSTDTVSISGCFESANPALGFVYVEATLDGSTGVGTTDIYTMQAANCAGSPTGAPQGGGDSPTVTTPQDSGASANTFDTDQDNCEDARELGPTRSAGGLRDPYNYWDFRSVPDTTGNRDAAVVGPDINNTVARFGAIGTVADPVNTAFVPAPTYHPAYDTGGTINGSAGTWNVRGGDGAIVGPDLNAVVAQFGNVC